MIHEVEFTARKLWDIRGTITERPFAAVDPGAEGCTVAYSEIGLTKDGLIDRPDAVFPMTVPIDVVAESLFQRQVTTMFVEAQYSGVNKMGTIRLARRAAYLPAFLAGLWAEYGRDVTVCWVAPATWQGVLRTLSGRPKLAKGDAKALAMEYAGRIFNGDGRFVGAAKAQQSGIADATAIALWAQRVLWMARE